MIKIRPDQLTQMEEARHSEYHASLSRFLRKEFPQLVGGQDDAELSKQIAAASPRARVYGIRSARGTAAFVGLWLAAGPSFDEDPEIQRFLTWPNLCPELKIRNLMELTIAQLEKHTDR